MMNHSETAIHYIQVGDYYIPDFTLPQPSKSVGKWGRLYRGICWPRSMSRPRIVWTE